MNTSISPPSTRGTPGLVTWQRWSVTYVEIKFRTPRNCSMAWRFYAIDVVPGTA